MEQSGMETRQWGVPKTREREGHEGAMNKDHRTKLELNEATNE